MRIEYGLSQTSLSSLLDSRRESSGSSAQSNTSHASHTPPAQPLAKPPASSKPQPKEPAATQTHAGSAPRETFGLEILEKMSEREYQVFLRASEGLSEVEKMAAAQALYVFTESAKTPPKPFAQAPVKDPATAKSHEPVAQSPTDSPTPSAMPPMTTAFATATMPAPPKNPYFHARDSFITRYVALYHGAQEMDILG